MRLSIDLDDTLVGRDSRSRNFGVHICICCLRMPTSSVKLDAVGRLRTIVVLIVNVSAKTIMSHEFCLSTQILGVPKAISIGHVGIPMRQDVLTSGYHLRCVGELLAIEDERTAVFVQGTLCVMAHVHSLVHLLVCLIVALLSNNQVLINIIFVRTDLLELHTDFLRQPHDVLIAESDAFLERFEGDHELCLDRDELFVVILFPDGPSTVKLIDSSIEVASW